MTHLESAEARLLAHRAGFPVTAEHLTADDGEEYAVRVQDVEAGRNRTFLHLASVVAFIEAATAEEKGNASAA